MAVLCSPPATTDTTFLSFSPSTIRGAGLDLCEWREGGREGGRKGEGGMEGGGREGRGREGQ